MHPMTRTAAMSIGLLCSTLIVPAVPAATTVFATLRWTAPGDDGMSGRAQAYSLRYSTSPISEANFSGATPVSGLPAPAAPGTTETFTVPDLAENTVYFFAIKTRDDAGNWSPISNVASLTPLTTDVGDPPASFSFSAPWPNPARAGLTVAFSLPAEATVEVDAFAVDGRRVRHLAGGRRPPGHAEIAWDLRDEAGKRVPAGVYLIRARLGGAVWSRRVAVVR